MKNVFFLLLALLLISNACKKTHDNNTHVNGKEYVNSKIGSWIIYNVDSIVFSDFNITVQKIDTFKFQVKEVIAGVFFDGANQENTRIERFQRLIDTLPWQITNVWSSKITASDFEKVEENIRYVKLVFPANEFKVWPGNKYNNLPSLDYTYLNVKGEVSLPGKDFFNTITVLQRDSAEDNFVEKGFAMEIYAENIGMIYKRNDAVEVQNNIKKGVYYRQTAIDWSK